MRAALHFESEKRQRHMALLKAPLKQPKTTTLQVRLNEEVSGGGSGLSIREQHCLAAERIAEKRMECNRFATGTARPISLPRRVTVDSDEQSFECHVGLYAPDGPSGSVLLFGFLGEQTRHPPRSESGWEGEAQRRAGAV